MVKFSVLNSRDSFAQYSKIVLWAEQWIIPKNEPLKYEFCKFRNSAWRLHWPVQYSALMIVQYTVIWSRQCNNENWSTICESKATEDVSLVKVIYPWLLHSCASQSLAKGTGGWRFQITNSFELLSCYKLTEKELSGILCINTQNGVVWIANSEHIKMNEQMKLVLQESTWTTCEPNHS